MIEAGGEGWNDTRRAVGVCECRLVSKLTSSARSATAAAKSSANDVLGREVSKAAAA